MDIEKHHEEFRKIIDKYNLNSEENAEKISHFLTKHHAAIIDSDEFAEEFNMEKEEAKIFLQFIEKGIRFKQEMDKNK